MVVAIDGPAGAGKSTVARHISQELGFVYLNSGNLYRAITFLAQEKKLSEPIAIIALIEPLNLKVAGDSVFADDRILTTELRLDTVEREVAVFSRYPEIRNLVNEILLKLSKNNNVVVEGRDMTTVVFPNADIKFYLDASIDSRANRRFDQGTSTFGLDAIKKSIQERDSIDQSKVIGALRRSGDAEYLDTTDLTIDQVCAKVVRSIQGHILRQEKKQGHGR